MTIPPVYDPPLSDEVIGYAREQAIRLLDTYSYPLATGDERVIPRLFAMTRACMNRRPEVNPDHPSLDDESICEGIIQAINAWRSAHPLAFQRCPCESGHCEDNGIHAAGHCPNHAGGDRVNVDPVMLYLGPCCESCARAMVAAGGAEYVMTPIGTATEYIG